MSILELYLLFVIVPKVGVIAIMVLILSLFLVLLVGAVVCLESAGGDYAPGLTKALTKICIVGVIAGTIAVLCPTQGDLIKIYGLNVLTNTAGAEKLPEDIVKYLRTIINTEGEVK